MVGAVACSTGAIEGSGGQAPGSESGTQAGRRGATGSIDASAASGSLAASGGGRASDLPYASSGSSGAQAEGGQQDGRPRQDAALVVDAAGSGRNMVDDASTQESGLARGIVPPANRQSLLWLWQGYAAALDTIAANAQSFTHVSPAFYQLNYDYSSGPAAFNGGNNFDGMSAAQVTQRIHAAGLKCVPMVQAGAGNSGTDQGIQNVLDDQPAGAQNSFITSMLTEAQSNGYDGYNLDWEVDKTYYSVYGQKYLSFLSAFKQALNARGMALSIEIGDWYTLQCAASCTTGLVDLTHIGDSVDSVIIMNYSDSLGSPAAGCPPTVGLLSCDNFSGGLTIMCNVNPPLVVNIGLMAGPGSAGANQYLDKALEDVAAYGFPAVAVWPGGSAMPSSQGVPGGASWYSLLAHFLGK
jgi:Glycosyl hydrolases family 18